MLTKIKFPSKRLMLALLLSFCSVILLEASYFPKNSSFLFLLFSVLVGFLFAGLLFIPSAVIKSKTDLGFIAYADKKTPSAVIFVSALYCIYFVYTAEYFLLKYSDMFSKRINSDANIYAVAFILLACAVYSACKGANAAVRCSLFIFAFSLIAFVVIISGNISNLEIKLSDFNISGSQSDFISTASLFATPAFTAVIFAVLSGSIKNFRSRHIAITLIIGAAIFGLYIFFALFALGDYAQAQEYSAFLLSKTAHFESIGGLDSFFLASSLLCVFLVLSLSLICICKSSGKSGSPVFASLFALLIFILFISSSFFYSVKKLLTDPYVFNVLTVICAAAVPCVYIIFGRRRLNV